MLVELPLSYRAFCKPFRARHASSVELLDFVSVEVREVSGDDAPVAVRISDEGYSETLRWFDGKYWMEDAGLGLESGRLRAKLTLRTERDIERLGSEGLFLIQNCPNSLEAFKARAGRTVESERCREVTGTDREASLGRLLARTNDGMVAIDGVLHVAVREPFLVLTIQDDGLVYSSVGLGMPYLEGSRNRTLAFPLDCPDEFDAVLSSITREESVKFYAGLAAEYFYGETTPVRREAEDIRSCVKEWREEDIYQIRNWSKDRAVAWFDLRDSYDAAKEDGLLGDETVLDSLSDLLSEYSRHADIGPFARSAIERWQMREIEIALTAEAFAPAFR